METERICPTCRKPLPPDVPLGLCPECLMKSGFPTGTEPGAGAMGRFVPPPVEEIAKLFPQFEIISFIGKGGMGAVYKARQPGLDRLVALKILPPTVGNDPGFAERFNREARALARLSHPNIVVVYDFGKAGDLHYLVMEFVDGTNLREVERAGRLSPEQALAIVPQICEALQFAHNEGIVHRDIKPENLLLDKKGRVKIGDFGIAKILGATEGKVSLTGARDVMGTPHYMAPEQIEKPQTVDHRADIYSLGVVFYEMLTGELPLGKFAPPSKKVQMDVRLDEVVLHALEKEPERRYQQASQVKTDVETIATGAPPPVSGPSAAPPTPALPSQPVVSDRLILPAFLLAFFFGIFGAHRFYVGRIRTGLLQLAGLGGCVIMTIACATLRGDQMAPGILLATFICGCAAWAAIDWILILCKVFTDGNGRRLVNWWHPNPNAPKVRVNWQIHVQNPNAPTPPAPPKPPVPPIAGAAVPGGGSVPMIIAPAVGLIIAGCLKLFGSFFGILYLLSFGAIEYNHSFFFFPGFIKFLSPLAGTAVLLFSVIPAAVIIYGGVEMFRLRSYGWALAGAIVAILFCSLLGTPVGIWALIVLLMAGVRETFVNRPAPPAPYKGLLILGAAAAACLLLFLTISFVALLAHMHHGAAANSPPPMVLATPAPPFPPLPPAYDRVPEAERLATPATTNTSFPPLPPAPIQIKYHYQVFEADAGLIDKLIPPDQRHSGYQTNAESSDMHTVDNPGRSTFDHGNFHMTVQGTYTDPEMAEVSADALNELLRELPADPGLLATGTQTAWGRHSPETWNYTRNELTPNTLTGSGSGNLFIGAFPGTDGATGVRIEGRLNHNLDMSKTPLIPGAEAKILFAGEPPGTGAVVFLVPFLRRDESEHYLVVAFDFPQLAQPAQPIASAPPAPQPTAFSVVASGTLPLSYQWYSSPTNLPPGAVIVTNSANYSSVTIPVYEKDDAGDSSDFSKSFAVDPNGSLTMDVDRGDVQITGGGGGTVEIRVERQVRSASDADASKILKAEYVVLEHNGDQVSITAQNPFVLHSSSWWSWWNQANLDVHYEITVPRNFTVQSKTSGGDVKVSGVLGKVNITTMGGELECTDIGGAVDGKTMGGSVHARGCSGALDLQTMGGDITVDEFSGPDVQATTSGGSVSADFAAAPTADCELHTMGGNVTVRLPDAAAVTVDGRTMGGSVRTDFPLETKAGFGNDSVDGPINGGGPALKMDTSGGNIEVLKR
jgi:predicted Ser/Thr protein kinase